MREGHVLLAQYEGIVTGAEMMASIMEKEIIFASACLMLIRREFLQREKLLFHAGVLHEDTAYSYELFLRAGRTAYLNEILYLRRLRNNSITTGQTAFRHPYGMLVGYLDMLRAYGSCEEKLTSRERSAALHRLEWMLDTARERYLKMDKSEFGSEYGLGEDFTLFRSYVSSCCEEVQAYRDSEQNRARKEKELSRAKQKPSRS